MKHIKKLINSLKIIRKDPWWERAELFVHAVKQAAELEAKNRPPSVQLLKQLQPVVVFYHDLLVDAWSAPEDEREFHEELFYKPLPFYSKAEIRKTIKILDELDSYLVQKLEKVAEIKRKRLEAQQAEKPSVAAVFAADESNSLLEINVAPDEQEESSNENLKGSSSIPDENFSDNTAPPQPSTARPSRPAKKQKRVLSEEEMQQKMKNFMQRKPF